MAAGAFRSRRNRSARRPTPTAPRPSLATVLPGGPPQPPHSCASAIPRNRPARRPTPTSLIPVPVTGIQPPRVRAVNDSQMTPICRKQMSLSCPRTWAGWIPVTSTGMRWGGERRRPKQASGMAAKTAAASNTRHGPFSATQQCPSHLPQLSCRKAHPNSASPGSRNRPAARPTPTTSFPFPTQPPQPSCPEAHPNLPHSCACHRNPATARPRGE
jgi:hypothetical protein